MTSSSIQKRPLLVAALLSFLLSLPAQANERIAQHYLQKADKPWDMVTLDFKNKVTLLVFWKADCVGCRAALAEAMVAQDTWSAKGLQTYGIYADIWSYYEDRAKVQANTKLMQLHDPALRFYKGLVKSTSFPLWIAVNEGGEILQKASTPTERRALLLKMREIFESASKEAKK